jgi:hypothetical protein
MNDLHFYPYGPVTAAFGIPRPPPHPDRCHDMPRKILRAPSGYAMVIFGWLENPPWIFPMDFPLESSIQCRDFPTQFLISQPRTLMPWNDLASPCTVHLGYGMWCKWQGTRRRGYWMWLGHFVGKRVSVFFVVWCLSSIIDIIGVIFSSIMFFSYLMYLCWVFPSQTTLRSNCFDTLVGISKNQWWILCPILLYTSLWYNLPSCFCHSLHWLYKLVMEKNNEFRTSSQLTDIYKSHEPWAWWCAHTHSHIQIVQACHHDHASAEELFLGEGC